MPSRLRMPVEGGGPSGSALPGLMSRPSGELASTAAPATLASHAASPRSSSRFSRSRVITPTPWRALRSASINAVATALRRLAAPSMCSSSAGASPAAPPSSAIRAGCPTPGSSCSAARLRSSSSWAAPTSSAAARSTPTAHSRSPVTALLPPRRPLSKSVLPRSAPSCETRTRGLEMVAKARQILDDFIEFCAVSRGEHRRPVHLLRRANTRDRRLHVVDRPRQRDPCRDQVVHGTKTRHGVGQNHRAPGVPGENRCGVKQWGRD